MDPWIWNSGVTHAQKRSVRPSPPGCPTDLLYLEQITSRSGPPWPGFSRCAFDYRWRPVARDEGDPPFSWSLSFVLGIRGSNAGFLHVTAPIWQLFAGGTRSACERVYVLVLWWCS
eukprot:scaffold29823_cov89-Phaeocystis_antarctica.AAC.1